MQMQIISETLLDKRDSWQNSTIIETQKRLNSHPAGKYLVADYNKSLVVVYGNTQIGKTSLILNLMGVLPEYQKTVYTVFRAGQDYGDSSTVTAIFYLVSENDNYGISFGDPTNNSISYYTDNEMIQQLSAFRKKIESGKHAESLLYLLIPRKYFSRDSLEKETISILDLPGINSKNTLERAHVDKVIAKYSSLATAKMIVTRGDSIQDLDTIEVPEKIDWRAFPNKYFVVVTMAFSQGSVKNYFSIDKSKRELTFIEYVANAYKEIPEIIKSEDIEWYPIDIGESFTTLLTDYVTDSEEIKATQLFYLNSIREAISKRRGNGLRNIINDLRVYSNNYYKVNILRISESITKTKDYINRTRANLSTIRIKRAEYQNSIDNYTAEDMYVFRMVDYVSLQAVSKTVTEDIESFFEDLRNNYPNSFTDHNLTIKKKYVLFVKRCLGKYSSFLINLREDLRVGSADSYLDLSFSFNEGDLYKLVKDILVEQELILENTLRPKGIQFYIKKVNRADLIRTLSNMCNAWKSSLEKNISKSISEYISRINGEKEKYYLTKHLLGYLSNEESRLKQELSFSKKFLKDQKRELKIWNEKESSDNQLLAEYMNLAEIEYHSAKAKIKSEMSGKSLSVRLQHLLLLGLMEQDYNSITEVF